MIEWPKEGKGKKEACMATNAFESFNPNQNLMMTEVDHYVRYMRGVF
jgi:hypothetical protein